MNSKLDITALFLQALSLEILFRDYNNSDLMQELQRQDTEYFDKIIKNQEEILALLRKEDTQNDRRKNN